MKRLFFSANDKFSFDGEIENLFLTHYFFPTKARSKPKNFIRTIETMAPPTKDSVRSNAPKTPRLTEKDTLELQDARRESDLAQGNFKPFLLMSKMTLGRYYQWTHAEEEESQWGKKMTLLVLNDQGEDLGADFNQEMILHLPPLYQMPPKRAFLDMLVRRYQERKIDLYVALERIRLVKSGSMQVPEYSITWVDAYAPKPADLTCD